MLLPELEGDVTDVTATVDRLLVREVLERYVASADDKDYDGIAGCFMPDAVSYYNDEPDGLHGGKGVATWLHRVVDTTDGALSNAPSWSGRGLPGGPWEPNFTRSATGMTMGLRQYGYRGALVSLVPALDDQDLLGSTE